jgi:hypothetical protein
MNTRKMFKGVILGMALLMAASAFAANKGSLQLIDPVTVNGRQLAAGDYSLQWDGSGNSVQLSVLQGKKVVATIPAQLINLDQSPNHSAAIVKNNADGSKTLAEIRFGGKKYALAIGADSAQSEPANSTK